MEGDRIDRFLGFWSRAFIEGSLVCGVMVLSIWFDAQTNIIRDLATDATIALDMADPTIFVPTPDKFIYIGMLAFPAIVFGLLLAMRN